MNVLFVHQREARISIKGSFRNIVVSHRDVRVRVIMSGHRIEARTARRRIADEPHVAAFDTANVRETLLPHLLATPIRPDSGRLGNMGVDIDHLVAV